MKKLSVFILILAAGCSTAVIKQQQPASQQMTVINSNQNGTGPSISLELYKGEAFYYPLMAAWLEDESGRYIQTLYVANSVATGIFKYGKKEKNMWVAAPKRAPQTLPYWAHKRGVKASDGLFMPDPENPVPDSYSGATPTQSFIINSKADKDLPQVYKVMFEINQNWDYNEYWTNDKFPGDENYKMSCQPALVFEAIINSDSENKLYKMKPAGHSHYSGKTGEIFTDLSTLTSALHIADSVIVKLK